MSRGKKLQEMEVKTQQSKTAVNSGAKPADPMPTMADPGTQLASVEDLDLRDPLPMPTGCRDLPWQALDQQALLQN